MLYKLKLGLIISNLFIALYVLSEHFQTDLYSMY